MNEENAYEWEGAEIKESSVQYRGDRLYIFVADGMSIGGIETLLIRMANQIADLGYRVIIAAQDGPCLEAVGEKVSTYELHSNIPLSRQLENITIESSNRKPRVFIWSATPYNLVWIYKYQKYLNNKHGLQSIAVSGIFGPARSVGGLRRRYDMIEHRLVLGWLPKNSVYFMSDAVQQTYVEQFGSSFRDWPIHKLALGRSNADWRSSARGELKVVSIGRITNFKLYNFGALDVVETMVERKIPISWEIWGHGDQSESLQDEILNRRFSSHIKFRGELPYSQFTEVVSDADLFVGMGTAALEAADVGVPTVVALTWSKLETYGFLYQCPADSIGERVSGATELNLIDVIADYSKRTSEEREEIGRRCREAVALKTSNAQPPFDPLFEGGVEYPSTVPVAARMRTFGLAQNIWVLIKSIVNFGKLLKRNILA